MSMTRSCKRGPFLAQAGTICAWTWWALWVTTLLTGLLAADRQASRIVATGDIHGRWERLVTVMQHASLLDDRYSWSGGDATFVVMGDFMDRGPDVRRVMDLLMRLQKEAPGQDGEVVVLLGNHEMMNIIGDYRYVTLEIFSSFADKDSEKRRREAFKRYRRAQAAQTRLLGTPVIDEGTAEEVEAEWMRNHPPGFVEYVEAMGARKSYGKWLRTLPVIVRLGDTVFVHGGIHPAIRHFSIKEMNERVDNERDVYDKAKRYLVQHGVMDSDFTLHEALTTARAYFDFYTQGPSGDNVNPALRSNEELVRVLRAFLGMNTWLSIHADGPLWFRGFAKWTDEEAAEKIGPLLDTYHARRFVVGHTVLGQGITRRFDDRVILIDTERPSALEIRGDALHELYADTPDASSQSEVEDMAAPVP